jgi:lactate dehydrogenase-like 2-hydroxyacid dehydrogenase
MRILSCVPLGAKALPGHQVLTCGPREIADHVQGVDVVVPGVDGIVDRPVLDRGSFGLVLQPGVGIDTIDVEAATARGVWVAHVPGANAPSVAEHAVFLALAVSRRLHEAEAALAARKIGEPVGAGLKGKTACIIGLGHVGSELARRLQAFDMTLVGVSPQRVQIDGATLKALYTPDQLVAAVADADYVFLCAAGETNTALIDRQILSAMKRGAFLVNIARGKLVDSSALVDALQSGQLAGAGLDVFADEPIDPAAPLLKQPNVVATPHIAGDTDVSFAAIHAALRRDLEAYARHERFPGLVNAPASPRFPLSSVV